MNRAISAICIIVFLGLTMQGLDAWKHKSSSSKDQRRMEKRRVKRQSSQFFNGFQNPACNFDIDNGCRGYISDISRSGSSLQNTIHSVQQYNFFLTGLVSVPALQKGGMCAQNSNLFTANAFSAIDLGHITLPQLATLKLFPVQSVDSDTLLNAGYINPVGPTNYLSALGVQASIVGHIIPSQLRQLNLYPLPRQAVAPDALTQAGYLTNDCIPTALGLSAFHIRYLPTKNLAAFGCQTTDYSRVTIPQLAAAKYVYGPSNILTPVGLAALHTGLFTKETYQGLGIFPYTINNQIPPIDYADQDQQQQPPPPPPVSNGVDDLVNVGYLHPKNNLLTSAAYYAILNKYLTVDQLRSLNVWPCPGVPSMNTFVSAGYATYSGHLTALGYSLLHAQYYPLEWLRKLGTHLHDEYHIFHHALRYGGFFGSNYHTAQNTLRNFNNNPNFEPVESTQSPVSLSEEITSVTDNPNEAAIIDAE